MKILLIGSGKAGLGIVCPLFNKAGYEIFNTDKNEDCLRSISRGYFIETPKGDTKILVNTINMLDVRDEFDIVITSVGRKNLQSVYDWYSKKNLSSPVILAENLQKPDKLFPCKIPIVIDRVCSRIEERNQGLFVITEEYLDVSILDHPLIKPLEIFDNVSLFGSEEEVNLKNKQKIFTVNTSHVISALYGEEKKFLFIEEAVSNQCISSEIKIIMSEVSAWLGFDPEYANLLSSKILMRFSSPIKDPISRILGPEKYQSALRYLEIPLMGLKDMGAPCFHLEKAYKKMKNKINQ